MTPRQIRDADPRPWNPEWTKHRLKWFTCWRCGQKLDYLVPIDTAANFNIIKAMAVFEAHHDDCPGIAS